MTEPGGVGVDNEERFWSKVDKSGECWTWTGKLSWKGYGRFEVGGKVRAAHRVAYEMSVGPIPTGLHVCHHCDNPPCVRPAHLWVGTNAENMADASRKGRLPNAKLTIALVPVIRAAHAEGVSKHELARRYGVDRRTIQELLSRETWAHVD